MIRCILIKELRCRIRTGTWGIVLMTVTDGRLMVIFDGQANALVLPARFVRVVIDG